MDKRVEWTGGMAEPVLEVVWGWRSVWRRAVAANEVTYGAGDAEKEETTDGETENIDGWSDRS
jgi:hypothetical protein